LQTSDFRFQIADFRFQIADGQTADCQTADCQTADCQIARLQISNCRSDRGAISDGSAEADDKDSASHNPRPIRRSFARHRAKLQPGDLDTLPIFTNAPLEIYQSAIWQSEICNLQSEISRFQ
jgi:hypothetical protein